MPVRICRRSRSDAQYSVRGTWRTLWKPKINCSNDWHGSIERSNDVIGQVRSTSTELIFYLSKVDERGSFTKFNQSHLKTNIYPASAGDFQGGHRLREHTLPCAYTLVFVLRRCVTSARASVLEAEQLLVGFQVFLLFDKRFCSLRKQPLPPLPKNFRPPQRLAVTSKTISHDKLVKVLIATAGSTYRCISFTPRTFGPTAVSSTSSTSG